MRKEMEEKDTGVCLDGWTEPDAPAGKRSGCGFFARLRAALIRLFQPSEDLGLLHFRERMYACAALDLHRFGFLPASELLPCETSEAVSLALLSRCLRCRSLVRSGEARFLGTLGAYALGAGVFVSREEPKASLCGRRAASAFVRSLWKERGSLYGEALSSLGILTDVQRWSDFRLFHVSMVEHMRSLAGEDLFCRDRLFGFADAMFLAGYTLAERLREESAPQRKQNS